MDAVWPRSTYCRLGGQITDKRLSEEKSVVCKLLPIIVHLITLCHGLADVLLQLFTEL